MTDLIRKESAGGIILNQLNEVVIVFNPAGSWQFPKGGVEKGEKYLDAALREIKEETGLTNIKLIKKLPVYTRPSIDEKKRRCLRDIYYFLFKTEKQKLNPGAEVNFCEWISIDKVENKLTYKEDKDFFRRIKSEL